MEQTVSLRENVPGFVDSQRVVLVDVRSGSDGATAVILIDNGTPSSTPIGVARSSIVRLAERQWQVIEITVEESDHDGVGAGPGWLSLRLID